MISLVKILSNRVFAETADKASRAVTV